MIGIFTFLISGVVFGLSAGISPGPLLTLAISETLKFGKKEGVKIAIAPLITDIPIILLTVFILASLSKIGIFLGFISLIGGLFLFRVAYENFEELYHKISTFSKPLKCESFVRIFKS